MQSLNIKKPTPELTVATLLKYMQVYGLTQQRLADALDVNVVTVNRWVNRGIPKHYNKILILALAQLATKLKKINRAFNAMTPPAKTVGILNQQEED